MSPHPTSRTDAFATPEAATTTIAQSARVEYREMASGSRLLPRSATQPRAASPPTQSETPTTWRNRLVVARSCEADDAECPVRDTGSRAASATPSQIASGLMPIVHRQATAMMAASERLHEQCPAERRVEGQGRDQREREVGQRPREHVADRENEHQDARDRPHARPARCERDRGDGQPLDDVLARGQQEHRGDQESRRRRHAETWVRKVMAGSAQPTSRPGSGMPAGLGSGAPPPIWRTMTITRRPDGEAAERRVGRCASCGFVPGATGRGPSRSPATATARAITRMPAVAMDERPLVGGMGVVHRASRGRRERELSGHRMAVSGHDPVGDRVTAAFVAGGDVGRQHVIDGADVRRLHLRSVRCRDGHESRPDVLVERHRDLARGFARLDPSAGSDPTSDACAAAGPDSRPGWPGPRRPH